MIRPFPLALSLAVAAAILPLAGDPLQAQPQPGDARPQPTLPSAARQTELSVLWKAEIGKSIVAAPAVAGQTVFVADQAGRLTALDVSTGKQQWQTDLGSTISASPLVADGVVYVGDEQGKFHAVQAADGKDRVLLTAGDKIVGRAAALGGVIYVGAYDHYLYALDAASGKTLWSFQTQAQVNAGPVIAADAVLVAGCDAMVRSLDAKTGQQRWAIDAGGPVAAGLLVSSGPVFAATLKGDRIAIDPTAGKLLWQTHESPENDGNTTFSASPVVSPISPDWIMFTAQSGTALHHDAASGKWCKTTQVRGRITATPVLWKGLVWAVTEEGRIYSSPKKTGQWMLRFTAGAGLKASATPSGDRLWVGDEDGTLWCLVEPAGKPLNTPK